jgi:gamma-glutamyl-gamma-aminobutyrate hydrolase PuuD
MLPSSKLVGITQRVVQVPNREETRDALDQAWAAFLAACGFDMIPIPNRLDDPVAYLEHVGVDAIILSGGGNVSDQWLTSSGKPPNMPIRLLDIAPERDRLESKLLHASIAQGWPVIGVCRGMQFINLFHGGRLETLSGHIGVSHRLSIVDSKFPFEGQVNSFHGFGVPVAGLGSELIVLAEIDGYAEAILHRRAKHLGIMWHPERNRPWSQKDIMLFADFLSGRAPYV